MNDIENPFARDAMVFGGIPRDVCIELLDWLRVFNETGWCRINRVTSGDLLLDTKEELFRKGLADFLGMHGYLRVLSRVQFATPEHSVDLVCEWYGNGRPCAEIVREQLSRESWWPSGKSAGDTLNAFTSQHFAVMQSVLQPSSGEPQRTLAAITQRVQEPSSLGAAVKIHFASVDGGCRKGSDQAESRRREQLCALPTVSYPAARVEPELNGHNSGHSVRRSRTQAQNSRHKWHEKYQTIVNYWVRLIQSGDGAKTPRKTVISTFLAEQNGKGVKIWHGASAATIEKAFQNNKTEWEQTIEDAKKS